MGVATNIAAPPTSKLIVSGVTPTENKVATEEELTDIDAESLFVTLFRVASTVSVTIPALDPALNVVDCPVSEFRLPRVLFRDQRYVTPAGQVPTSHVTVAVKLAIPPVSSESSLGLTTTEETVATVVELIAIVTDALFSDPSSVAFTVRTTTPAFDPAVNVVDDA